MDEARRMVESGPYLSVSIRCQPTTKFQFLRSMLNYRLSSTTQFSFLLILTLNIAFPPSARLMACSIGLSSPASHKISKNQTDPLPSFGTILRSEEHTSELQSP